MLHIIRFVLMLFIILHFIYNITFTFYILHITFRKSNTELKKKVILIFYKK